jgi:aldose 1-epimerase
MRRLLCIVSCVVALAPAACQGGTTPPRLSVGPEGGATIETTPFGALPDGREVSLFTLRNTTGLQAKIINYGAIVVSLTVPDRRGQGVDVVLGYDRLSGYVNDKSYIGAVVGRYGNRIAKGRFTLEGKTYQLGLNDGENHLHGGARGFHKALWTPLVLSRAEEPALKLTYVSKDGEEGYPGTVALAVTYTLTRSNGLRIDYTATTDKVTILNPTNHAYFNLSGDPTRDILGEELTIDADRTTEVGPGLIPTGKLAEVANTPMDFRRPTTIGPRIAQDDAQLTLGRGYDHNWVLSGYTRKLRQVATLYDATSGIAMAVLTDQPGLQFYSGNFLDGTIQGKRGVIYKQRSALCLEAQDFPDSPNEPGFPSAVLKPGEVYRQTTIYQFSTR